jgi:hypothetical protein
MTTVLIFQLRNQALQKSTLLTSARNEIQLKLRLHSSGAEHPGKVLIDKRAKEAIKTNNLLQACS